MFIKTVLIVQRVLMFLPFQVSSCKKGSALQNTSLTEMTSFLHHKVLNIWKEISL